MVYRTSGATILSADEFLLHPAANERTELVRGHLRMMTPASAGHGLVSATVLRLLSSYVWQHRLGVCFADSTGYTLPNLPNTVRAPVSYTHLRAHETGRNLVCRLLLEKKKKQ